MSKFATAYAMKKKSRMASGGTVKSGDPTMNYYGGGAVGVNAPTMEKGVSHAGHFARLGKDRDKRDPMKEEDAEYAKEAHSNSLKELKSMKGPTSGKSGFAEGGMLTDEGYQSQCHEGCNFPCEIHEEASGFVDETAPNRMPNHQGLTDGGEQDSSHDMGIMGRAMKRHMMSRGGKVANSDELTAGFEPNEFDDLHLRDDLESEYTGENSGDEIGNSAEEKRRKNMIMRAMLRMKKK